MTDSPADDATLTLGELGGLVAALGVAVVAAVSLALAVVGAHDLLPVLAGSAVLGSAALVVLWRCRSSWPGLRVDWAELGALAVAAVLAAVMFLPGFPYAAGDKDPGVYVIHGMAIAREGSTHFTDEVVAQSPGNYPVQVFTPGARFPGLWQNNRQPDEVLPQFYHEFPALLATAHDIGGASALFQVNPLLAVLTVLLVLLATKRTFGWVPALVAVALLSTNMLQVWQAKYPATEILTQLFVVGATLGVILALRTGWRPAAGVAGALAGSTWLARPDGVLVVVMALGLLAALVAFRRWDARATWFSAGMAVTAPLVAYQAWYLNSQYSYTTEVPKPPVFAALCIVLALGAVAGRAVLPAIGRTLSAHTPKLVERWQTVAGAAIAVLFVVVCVLAWNRETLLGIDELNRNGQIIRSYDEQNLLRLSWFFTIPGLVLMAGGVAVVGLRRWDPARWVLVGPGLAFFPVYLWAARISPQMMWWGRRFIPLVMVTMVVLIAVAIGWLLESRGGRGIPLQVAGAAATVFLVVAYLGQSWPLRAHHEFSGSYDFTLAVGDVAGDEQAVFLWQFPNGRIFDPGRTFGGPLWFVDDQISAFLPREAPNDPAIDAYLAHFGADHEVFVVTPGLDEPEGFDLSRLELVTTIHQGMPLWEESKTSRPDETFADKQSDLFFDVSIWRVTGPSTVPPVPNPLATDPEEALS